MVEKLKHKINNSNFGSVIVDNQSRASSNRHNLNNHHPRKLLHSLTYFLIVDGNLSPIDTESDEQSYHYVESSSEGDPDAMVNYKNKTYWALPENVR